MKKNLFLATVLIAFTFKSGFTQSFFDFESLTIPVETGYWNGSDLSGSFGSTEISFENDYNSTYQSWVGFSYAYDTITTDNQYINHANAANSGHNFGTGYVPSDWMNGTYDNIPIVCSFSSIVNVQSLYITNNEYTADVILNGDAGFGILPFSDSSYFKIIIEGKEGDISKGYVEYYLADYRSGGTFLLDTWAQIDLSSLGTIDSLKFNLESSDTGVYGMNTPAYFCIDDLAYTITSSTELTSNNKLKIYPNPASDKILLHIPENSRIEITDLNGKKILEKNNCSKNEIINISNLHSGIYILKNIIENSVITKKFIKN